MKWISTKCKLPSDKETVLVLFANNSLGFAHRLVSEDSSYWICFDEIIPDDEIVYWIPLFEIPKPKSDAFAAGYKYAQENSSSSIKL